MDRRGRCEARNPTHADTVGTSQRKFKSLQSRCEQVSKNVHVPRQEKALRPEKESRSRTELQADIANGGKCTQTSTEVMKTHLELETQN